MLAGKHYDSTDPELEAEKNIAKMIWSEYNKTKPYEAEKKRYLLNTLFRDKTDVNIDPPFRCEYGSNIKFGKNCFINYNCTILDICKVEFGDHVLIAPNVSIYGAFHDIEPNKRFLGNEIGAPIKIGNNVWIGGNAVICPGVTIGDNSVIGAGSVVVKDIPANSVAVGNPAKVIRKIETQVE